MLDDKMLFATQSAPALYWPGAGTAKEIPGLPSDSGWDGITVIGNRVVLWRGQTIKSSVTGDFALWIPVALTAVTGRAIVDEQFQQPDVGGDTGWIFLRDVSGSFTPGQFVRLVSNENDPQEITYNYYTVAEFATKESTQTYAIGKDYFVQPGNREVVFVRDNREWPVGARLVVEADLQDMTVFKDSREIDNESLFTGITILDTGEVLPNIGEELSVSLAQYPSGLLEGDYVYIGDTQTSVGDEIFEVVTVGQVLRLKRLGIGTDIGPVGRQISGFVFWQPWVEFTNIGTVDVNFAQGSQLYASDSIRLVNLNLSAATTIFENIPTETIVETVDANDAFEGENVGSDINGDIYQIIPLGEYAYILKENSIQSMQPVDVSAGTWIIRPEILGEGPIGRYASVRINDQVILFWGKAEFYMYSGGKTLTPVVTDSTSLAYEELDRARTDEIVAAHFPDRQEVRFYYPTLDSRIRALVFNYHYNTVVYDELSSNWEAVTAAGEVAWEMAPRWLDVDVTLLWASVLTPKRWYEFVDEGKKFYLMLGIEGDTANTDNGETTGVPQSRLLIGDRVYYWTSDQDCSPTGYEALVETADLDWGEPMRWKYADTVYLSLQVDDASLRALHPLKLYVQLGSRNTLDDDIDWGQPVPVEISGNLSGRAVANAKASGRYIRARFYSNQPGARWRIAEYAILARVGGTV